MAGQFQARFDLLNEEDLDRLLDDSDSKNTKRQLKFSMKVFGDFCAAVDIDQERLADVDLQTLDGLLSKFYAGVKKRQGEDYSKKSMQALRYGLQKHFLNVRDVDIVKDKEFPKSGKIFKSVINQLKQKGKANVKHHKPVSEKDMNLIQDSFDLDDPQGLQRKVFIAIMVYFANRGQENLHDMKPDDFILSEKDGRRCIYFVDKSTKNHQDDDMSSQGGLMFELPGNARCPVASVTSQN